MRRNDQTLSAADRCAIGGAIVLAIAGLAAPFYARPGIDIWLAALLLIAAATADAASHANFAFRFISILLQ